MLWESCALPDYRRIAPAQHAELIGTIFTDLVREGRVNEDFLAEQVRRADRTEGEIETLSGRIAQIRTWTYVSHRPGWLADPTHWQEKTREIEDRLSDALHERLTKRFVDRRTSVLMKRLREKAMLEAEISVDGDVYVEGHHVGQLAGFRFMPDQSAEGPDAKAVLAAAQKALALEYEARAARLHASGNGDFALGSDGVLRWLGDPVGKLAASDSILRPRVILLADDDLAGAARDFVSARIERFVNHQVATVLKPLDDLSRAEDLEGLAKGLAFQLAENLGVLFRRDVAEEVKALDQEARGSLRRHGVRFGAYHIFMPALLKPAPAELITLLWALKNDAFDRPGYGDLIGMLAAGRTSIVTDPAFERSFYKLAGFRFLGKRAVRIDILERLSDLIRPALQWNPGSGPRPEGGYDGRRFTTTPAMLSILGATPDDIEEILKGLGYRADVVQPQEAEAHIAALDAADPSEERRGFRGRTCRREEGAGQDAAFRRARRGRFRGRGHGGRHGRRRRIRVAGGPAAGGRRGIARRSGRFTRGACGRGGRGRRRNGCRSGAGGSEARAALAAARAKRPGAGTAQPSRPDRQWHRTRAAAGRGKLQGQGQGRKGGKPGGRGQRDGQHDHQPLRSDVGGKGGRPPRKDKPVDPDSPFAKLAVLKEQMKK